MSYIDIINNDDDGLCAAAKSECCCEYHTHTRRGSTHWWKGRVGKHFISLIPMNCRLLHMYEFIYVAEKIKVKDTALHLIIFMTQKVFNIKNQFA
jgi:hypothetical protein